MGHRTFPKEGQKKLNQIIKDLKDQIKQKDKEIAFLNKELQNIMKPTRDRKSNVEVKSTDDWKKDFLRRYKRDVLGEKG